MIRNYQSYKIRQSWISPKEKLSSQILHSPNTKFEIQADDFNKLNI